MWPPSKGGCRGRESRSAILGTNLPRLRKSIPPSRCRFDAERILGLGRPYVATLRQATSNSSRACRVESSTRTQAAPSARLAGGRSSSPTAGDRRTCS